MDNIAFTNLYNYFKQLLGPQIETEKVHGNLLSDMRQNNDSSELNGIITDDGIRRSVSHLHLNKSPGPDGICIELYKCTIEYILPFLNVVFNNIFSSGNIHDSLG